eukprot:CAMPEP_0197691992 /NCGR_PEP_ID=MMETSP1338-20131121/110488_1 /TAXON_ID=43686 ORGANISM="Pelagodinium beii, Strain RCC1491" /NCGR_SAMPLE_ID=MMETSP1338 /ASSEMBLY_ACC=CAM_ASM_000754 /LENGTH=85 /DNA_ID=CAMNT_0043274601 /DNA_START=8 /DNA_END=261 /DNA_ORIENTATION=-
MVSLASFCQSSLMSSIFQKSSSLGRGNSSKIEMPSRLNFISMCMEEFPPEADSLLAVKTLSRLPPFQSSKLSKVPWVVRPDISST